MRRLSDSTIYLLKAFVPYSRANLQLSFKSSSFFYELEKKSKVKERTLRSAYYRALRDGLIELDDADIPRLTNRGLEKTKLYIPKKLQKGAKLMIIFDIPEDERAKRRRLRLLLRELRFKKVQQSVWVSQYDFRKYIASEIEESDLKDYVIVYEAAKIKI